LHWICYFVGNGLYQWAALFYFSFTLAYAADGYSANTSEMLIAMNVGKQAISTGVGVKVLDWLRGRLPRSEEMEANVDIQISAQCQTNTRSRRTHRIEYLEKRILR
jgi:hypothetical protein